MPSRGYATIGVKPAILSRLEKATDEYYPGMFLPSALIIMMNEIKRGHYSIGLHNIEADFSGQYTSLTIRYDVKTWLDQNYEKYKEDYDKKYRSNSFTHFAGIFMLNMFESKASTHNYIIRLKESDYSWLVDEYEKRRQEYKIKYGVQNFEQFADIFLKMLLDKVQEAKRILTL